MSLGLSLKMVDERLHTFINLLKKWLRGHDVNKPYFSPLPKDIFYEANIADGRAETERSPDKILKAALHKKYLIYVQVSINIEE